MITKEMRERFVNNEMTVKERKEYCMERLKEIIGMDGNDDMSREWQKGQFVCNQTKRERIFILLDNILDRGDRIEYRFDMKSDEEIKRDVLRYADILMEKAEELFFLATNMIVHYDNNIDFTGDKE